MTLSRRHFCAMGSLGLFGCGTPPARFQDSASVPPDRALALVQVQYDFWQQITEVEIGLTRLEAGKPPEDLALVTVPNHRIAVLDLPPGVYFLSRLRSENGFYRHTFEPRLTLFAARPGQINYPGDWSVNVRVVSSELHGTVGGGSSTVQYRIRMQAVENETVPALFAREFPKLNAELPLRITRTL